MNQKPGLNEGRTARAAVACLQKDCRDSLSLDCPEQGYSLTGLPPGFTVAFVVEEVCKIAGRVVTAPNPSRHFMESRHA
jgi:hypothetical protein